MSDVATSSSAAGSPPSAPTGEVTTHPRGLRRDRPTLIRGLAWLALLIILLILPLYLDEFWLRTGFAVFGAAVGAIGLNLLVGTTGQLSLAHAFFLAVGASTYSFLAGTSGGFSTKVSGLNLSPVLAGALAVLAAGVAGLLFSPIAARLRGIYLGIASIGLVFIGQHLLNTWTSVTGGFNGRSVPQFSFFGFSFGNANAPYLAILGVPYGPAERYWYLGLGLMAASYVFARNLIKSRPGRALQTLRDSETAAAVMGVNVTGYKARAFFVSSMYAGLSGVLYALSIGSIAPESFSLAVSVQFLAMIVLGGLGSVGGAVIGSVVVAALPLVFQQYAGALPFVSQVGSGGVVAGDAARFLYGAAIILILLFLPAGLAGLPQMFRGRRRRPSPDEATAVTPAAAAPSQAPAQANEAPPQVG